jgi:hypothetical protein
MPLCRGTPNLLVSGERKKAIGSIFMLQKYKNLFKRKELLHEDAFFSLFTFHFSLIFVFLQHGTEKDYL